MPDPVLIVTAMGVAVAASAVIFVICGWPGGSAVVRPGLTPGGSWAWEPGSSSDVGSWGFGPTGRRARISTVCWPWCFPAVMRGRAAGGFPPGAALACLAVAVGRRWRAGPGSCCTAPATSPTSPGRGHANGRRPRPG